MAMKLEGMDTSPRNLHTPRKDRPRLHSPLPSPTATTTASPRKGTGTGHDGSPRAGSPGHTHDAAAEAKREGTRQFEAAAARLGRVFRGPGLPQIDGLQTASLGTAAESQDGGYAGQRSGRRHSAFLPQIVGSVCPAGLYSGHPFFRGLQDEFLEALTKVTVRQSLEGTESDEYSYHRRQLMRGGGVLSDLFEKQEQRLKHRITLCTQGMEPTGNMNGIHITLAQDSGDLQALFNNFGLGVLAECYIYGIETALGLCKTSAFSVHISREPMAGLYFLPKQAFLDILVMKKFEEDAKILRERASKMLNGLVYEWFTRNPAKIKIRLFANMSGAFRQELLRGSTIRILGAGGTIRKTGEFSNSCFCIYQGEAEARIAGSQLLRVSHGAPQAWAAWWGFLQAIGPGTRSPVTITAITDCVIWDISSASLSELRRKFATECSFFDKVAMKHVQMLAPFVDNFVTIPLFKNAGAAFLAELNRHVTLRLCAPGEVVVKEHEPCDAAYYLALGVCSMYRGSDRSRRVAFLQEGSFVGEHAILGTHGKYLNTVVCDTVCDVRVLTRDDVERVVAFFPQDAKHFEQIGEAMHGGSRKVALNELARAFSGFSEGFVKTIADQLYDQMFFSGQTLIKQHSPAQTFFILTKGLVDVHVDGVKVATMQAPICFGENALLKPGFTASATVTGASIGDCLAMDTERLSSILHQNYPEDMNRIREGFNKKRSEGSDRMTPGNAAGTKAIAPDPTAMEESSSASASNSNSSYFFSDRDPAFLADLSQRLSKQVYFSGQVIIEEGSEGNFVYIIKQGTCLVEVGGARVGEVHPGGLLGEMFLLGVSSMHTATVKAIGTVVVFAVEHEQMLECLERFPQEKEHLMNLMAERQKRAAGTTEKGKSMKSMVNKVQRMRMLLGTENLTKLSRNQAGSPGRDSEEEKHAEEAAAHSRRRSVRGGRRQRGPRRPRRPPPPPPSSKELPGREEMLRWVQKRSKALERAEELRQKHDNKHIPIYPPCDRQVLPLEQLILRRGKGGQLQPSQHPKSLDNSTRRRSTQTSITTDVPAEGKDKDASLDPTITAVVRDEDNNVCSHPDTTKEPGSKALANQPIPPLAASDRCRCRPSPKSGTFNNTNITNITNNSGHSHNHHQPGSANTSTRTSTAARTCSAEPRTTAGSTSNWPLMRSTARFSEDSSVDGGFHNGSSSWDQDPDQAPDLDRDQPDVGGGAGRGATGEGRGGRGGVMVGSIAKTSSSAEAASNRAQRSSFSESFNPAAGAGADLPQNAEQKLSPLRQPRRPGLPPVRAPAAPVSVPGAAVTGLRFRKAKNVYGRPVWHEVFGAPLSAR